MKLLFLVLNVFSIVSANYVILILIFDRLCVKKSSINET